MVRRDREQLRAQNDELEERVQSMLEAFEQQTRQLSGLKQQLEQIRAQASSADGLVRVSANASGIPEEVWIAPEAFKRTTPEHLSASITQTAQTAARSALQQAAAAAAPITDVAESMDVSDLVPGAPNMRDVFSSFIPPADERTPPAPTPAETDDDGPYWTGLKDR